MRSSRHQCAHQGTTKGQQGGWKQRRNRPQLCLRILSPPLGFSAQVLLANGSTLPTWPWAMPQSSYSSKRDPGTPLWHPHSKRGVPAKSPTEGTSRATQANAQPTSCVQLQPPPQREFHSLNKKKKEEKQHLQMRNIFEVELCRLVRACVRACLCVRVLYSSCLPEAGPKTSPSN